MSDNEIGTFKCPICGSDEPHYHDANLQWKRLPADQLGWLIETGDHKYWSGRTANVEGFTDNPNDAVRFARFEDSERVIHWLMRAWSVFLVSRQHSWMGGIAKASPKEYQPLSGLTSEEKEHAPPRTHDASGKRTDGYGDPAKGEYNAFLADDGGDIPTD